jgi:drug/metabolite transporter (DMT)-like permease
MIVRLTDAVPVYEKVFLRSIVSLAITGAIALRSRENPFQWNAQTRLAILRGMFGTTAMTLYFYAIANLTLADATILNKLSPFFVILLAPIFLKEKLSRYVVPAIVVAFVGAVLVIKPQLDFQALPALGGLLSALASASAYTVVRYLRGKEPPYRIVFYFALVATVVTIPPMIVNFVPVATRDLIPLLATGVLATVGQLCLTFAYHQAPVTKISIYNYAHVLFALLIGLAVWGELPDRLALVGAVLIVCAAVYNHRRVVREVPPPT